MIQEVKKTTLEKPTARDGEEHREDEKKKKGKVFFLLNPLPMK